MALRDEIATPDAKRRHVRRLFATIAGRYDLITRLLSYGQDQRWKARLVALASPSAADRVLDLATGTGDLAFEAAARSARVVGLDVTPAMVALARRKAGSGRRPSFLVGDMEALPFPAGSFSLVTTGYGLRNVSDLRAALDEMYRVLKPKGAVLSLDFTAPSNALVRGAYLAYLSVVGGAIGWLLHGDADTYRYIPASLRDYPGMQALSKLMSERGFAEVRCYRVLGGLLAIHHATKP